MTTVKRFDAVTLAEPVLTPEGFLRAPMKATRIGVLRYFRDGKPFRELRHPDEVFSPESMATLAGKPVTDEHPAEGKVTATNARQLMRGFVGEAVNKIDGQYLGGMVTITDAGLVERVKSGARELSCGYDAELDMTPGIHDGEPYDAVQRNIRYNHLAVVDRGRAGKEVRLMLDADDNQIDEGQEAKMKKVIVDGIEIEVSDEQASKLEALQTKLDAGKAALELAKTEKARADQAEGKVAGLEAKLDAKDEAGDAEKAAKAHTDSVKAQVLLIEQAKKVLPAEKHDSLIDMDRSAIMKAVILHGDAEAKLDGKSDDFLAGRFEQAIQAPAKGDGGAGLGAAINGARQDGTKNDNADRITAATKKRQDAWKQPASGHLKAAA